jgi:hypothetical protein
MTLPYPAFSLEYVFYPLNYCKKMLPEAKVESSQYKDGRADADMSRTVWKASTRAEAPGLFTECFRGLESPLPRTEEAAEKRVIFLVLSTLCSSFWFLVEISDGLVGVYLTVACVVAGSRHTST